MLRVSCGRCFKAPEWVVGVISRVICGCHAQGELWVSFPGWFAGVMLRVSCGCHFLGDLRVSCSRWVVGVVSRVSCGRHAQGELRVLYPRWVECHSQADLWVSFPGWVACLVKTVASSWYTLSIVHTLAFAVADDMYRNYALLPPPISPPLPPSQTCLSKKDHTNGTYLAKRAAYLMRVAAALADCDLVHADDLCWTQHLGNPQRPALLVGHGILFIS